MSISLQTNFKVFTDKPIDDRIIATNSSSRDSIEYKYDGLSVFQTDTRQSWIWNQTTATWSYNVAGDGIYSGSGSVIGDTYVNLGIVGNNSGDKSNLFVWKSTIGSNNVYINNSLNRTSSGTDWTGISYKIQYRVDNSAFSYIEFNPDYTDTSLGGALTFGTNNTERMRINASGKVGILMTAYNQASFMVNGVASSEGIYLSPDNSNSADVGGGYYLLVDTSGSLKIRDTSPNSPDYLNASLPGYQVFNIVGGKVLIGGTTSISSYTPESRLEVYEPNALGTVNGSYILLKTLTQNPQGAGIGNSVKVREWALRDKSTNTTNDWYSWRYHNGISVDSSFSDPTSSTKTFWERDIATERQFFGSSGIKTVEIQSQLGGSHSLLIRNSTSKTFKWNDKYNISYLDDTSTFVVEGFNRNINQSGSIVSFNSNSFPANCVVLIEAYFSATRRQNIGISTVTYNDSQSGIRAIYKIDDTYNITTISSDTNIFTPSGTPSVVLGNGYSGNTSTQIYLSITVSNTGSYNSLSNVKWKLTVTPYPASPYVTPYTPSGNTIINIGGLI